MYSHLASPYNSVENYTGPMKIRNYHGRHGNLTIPTIITAMDDGTAENDVFDDQIVPGSQERIATLARDPRNNMVKEVR
jgi:hypothetical protein